MALTKASLIDLNGQELILDADGDTTITSDTDDQIDIKIAGTDTVVISGGAMALKGATPTFTIGDGGAEDTKIVFDGNAQDYYIGLDDTYDDLVIGKGNSLGTTPAISINENEDVCINGFSYALAGGAANYGNLTINGTEGGILEFADDGILSSFIAALDGSFQMLHQLAEPMLIGTNNAESIRVHATGEVTMTKQPAVLVSKSNSQLNIAVGSNVTIVFDNEQFDVGGDFSSNTFTAPVTGKYLVALQVRWQNIPTNINYIQTYLATTNGTRYMGLFGSGTDLFNNDCDYYRDSQSIVIDMDANDTFTVITVQSGGSQATDIGQESYLSIALLS